MCPSDHPYLLNQVYSPPFTSWGPGVEVVRDEVNGAGFPINVSISGWAYFKEPTPPNMVGGKLTGYPNSSATNWLWGGTHYYRIVLHCSSNPKFPLSG